MYLVLLDNQVYDIVEDYDTALVILTGLNGIGEVKLYKEINLERR